ncbi:MAG: 50S ribosomal protein L6 [Deltaproteobacteria bacterium]|nr:MAG: 50S ribosomal protein L6 [Deltaproteobacteria bacterium]
MSRIGKQPINIPAGVKVDLKGQNLTVTGPKGALRRDIMSDIELDLADNVIEVKTRVESKKGNAFRGLMRSLINNMVVGVVDGFTKVLLIEGVGYRASVSGKNLTLNVGYSNPVNYALPDGVAASVEGNNKIVLESIDKELLGLVASEIRQIRKPEPYKGKGIRYENEHIVRKVGKAGAA